MTKSDDFLRGRWRWIHEVLGLTPDFDELASLRDAWSGVGRHYHGIAHLESGLHRLGDVSVEAAQVGLAWFYHDAVYVVGRQDNEERSAEWLVVYAGERDLSPEMTNRLHDLILCTRDHQEALTDDPLWPEMNDTDLSILAADRQTYKIYVADVWREYSMVASRPAFVSGRLAFLSRVIKQPIFLTQAMRAQELSAIENIKAEIATLQDEEFARA